MSAFPDPEALAALFPPQRSDAFFEALYGDPAEGAYTIFLTCENFSKETALLHFELRRRPGKCLSCSITHGLPAVFERHPVLNLRGLVNGLCALLEWDAEQTRWKLGATESISADMYRIPLFLQRLTAQDPGEPRA